MLAKLSAYVACATALLGTVGAAEWQGNGQMRVQVTNGATHTDVGCLNQDGKYVADNAACATFTGIKNTTYVHVNPGWDIATDHWFFSTAPGQWCGSPRRSVANGYDQAITCAKSIDPNVDAHWTPYDSDAGQPETGHLRGQGSDGANFKSEDGQPATGSQAKSLITYFIGATKPQPGGQSYQISWRAL